MCDLLTKPRLALLAALLLLAAGVHAAADDAREAVQAAVDGEHRSAENRARDQHRHPVETLMFFGLEPDMTVVELWPGGGWYTDILAPVLKEEGKLYAASWDPTLESDYVQTNLAKYKEKIAAREVYGDVELTVLGRGKTDIAPPGSADLIVTFRNLHSWGEEFAAEVFGAAYTALKPGGVLGVVQHRADPDVPPDPEERTGYFSEERAIELAEAAGFELAARSDLNANPKDTKDYESGVWALPPSLRDGPDPKYLEIGESDRFTLKFVRPE